MSEYQQPVTAEPPLAGENAVSDEVVVNRRARTPRLDRLQTRIESRLIASPLARSISRSALTAACATPGIRRLVPRAATAAPGTPLGNVADKILFENDQVRIWEMRLAPGQKSDLHRHDLPYIIVQISGDKAGADFEADSGDEFGLAGKSFSNTVRPGRVMFVPPGGKETAKNTGRVEYHEILIELKPRRLPRGSGPGTSHSTPH